MTRRVLLLCAVLAGLLAGALPARAGEGWWGALDEGEAVSLADVMRGPRDYRGRVITFFCVFHTADGRFKYYPPNTPFSEQRHVNFSAWPDGAAVWQEQDFKSDLPFLYIARTHAQARELLRLPTFTRLEVTGKIRDVVRGKPAIEAFSFRATGHRVGKAVIDRVMDGNAYARAGTRQGYQLAARAFKEALRPDLPPTYDMMVRKLLADALRKLDFHDEADRYERGESVGLPELPEPDAGADLLDPPAGMGDLPEGFTGDGRARPPRAPQAAPPAGSANPYGDAPAAPGAGDPDGGPAPSGAPLPGAPRGFDEELPPADLPAPAPSYREPGASAPAPRVAPRRPRTGATPRPPPSGIPPKRRPRLSGVR